MDPTHHAGAPERDIIPERVKGQTVACLKGQIAAVTGVSSGISPAFYLDRELSGAESWTWRP